MRVSRRSMLAAGVLGVTWPVMAVAAQDRPAPMSLPIGWPDRVLGDGFWIRHGYACENTWYNPGWWHTGEDWYAVEGETAGAGIFAIAEGTVVFVGSDYPGRVVIVEHPGGLFSMYGHLDPVVAVSEGEQLERGQQLGTVFQRTDGSAPSHLHFEIRGFLFNDRVNGRFPENGVPCGVQCAPGPGYWPIDSPDHPSELGWRNPTHVIAGGQAAGLREGAMAAVAQGAAPTSPLRSAPGVGSGSETLAMLDLVAGNSYPLIEIEAGSTDQSETSAEAYSVWYRIRLPGGGEGWVSALTASTDETGSDGRPSALRSDFLFAVEAGG